MKVRFLHATLAILLTIVLVTPTTFLYSPPKAHAIGANVNVLADIPTWVNTAIAVVKSTITAVYAATESAALIALRIKAFYLDPLAFVLSGNLLKAITAGTIAFVIGKANGTGAPQFAADIQKSLQTLSDTQALSFFDEAIRNSGDSPWNTAIISQLSKEYLNKTSLAGFWAQNMDTLRRTSPNIGGYLSGNWRLGGVQSWFALTTQVQNNPYTAYPAAQNQLAALIGPGVSGATGARLKDLAHSNGFVSWCGSSDGFLGSMSTGVASGAAAAAVDTAGAAAYNNAYENAITDGDSAEEAQTLAKIAEVNAKVAAFDRAKAANAGNTVLGVSPGDPCTNADGTTGTIKTPGSAIVAGLNKALGGQQDNVTRMGDVGGQITDILGNMAKVLATVQFASKILGGPGSGGLFGVDTPTPGQTRSALRAYTSSPGNLGATNAGVFADAAKLEFSGPDMLVRVAQYETAMNTLRGPANTASTSISSFISYCLVQQAIASSTLAISTASSTNQTNLVNFIRESDAHIAAARNAFATHVAPTVARTDAATTTIATARALVQRIQDGLNSSTEVDAAAYIADLQTLQAMPPTVSDLAVAQQDAIVTPAATAVADPPGSLNVSGIYLIEKLNLLSTNATALYPACTAPVATSSFGP